MTASFHVLTTGYADTRVAGTVTLLVDGATVAIVDPGMVADRRLILDPLAPHGLAPEDVTDVIFSHHHPDHTLNAALFPEARFHDHMAIYHDDVWEDRNADGYRLSSSITLMTTPGHTAEDVSTLVAADEGLVVLTHLWWSAEGPADDPFAPDRDQLRAAREKVLALGPVLIVPGHGAPFAPSAATPLQCRGRQRSPRRDARHAFSPHRPKAQVHPVRGASSRHTESTHRTPLLHGQTLPAAALSPTAARRPLGLLRAG